VGLAVIDEELEDVRSGTRVDELEFQDQVGIGGIPRHLEEARALESLIKLVVGTILTSTVERGGEAGVGKEDFFSGKDGRRNGASRGGGRLLGEASHRRKQDETGNKTEFQSEAVQRKFSLRTNIHSFGAFRQAWTGKEENGGILVQKG
jgi:hypothetical protein